MMGIGAFVIGVLVSVNSQIIKLASKSAANAPPITSMMLSGFTQLSQDQQQKEDGSKVNDAETIASKKKRAKRRTRYLGKPAALFNNVSVYYRNNNPLHSTVSCLGENFQEDAWKFRSCKYRNLCFNVSSSEFLIFQSQEQAAFETLAAKQGKFTHPSSLSNLHVGVGGINPKWKGEVKTLRWVPRVIKGDLTEGYYEFAPDTIWVPFHSFAGYNVGHLVWDDFFPIFKLLSIFSFVESSTLDFQLILSLLQFKLWGTCDWNPKNYQACFEVTFPKFLPAMGLTNETAFSIVHESRLETIDGSQPKTDIVCSPHGAAGMGILTDHGFKLHGWNLEDYKTTHNVGRGKMLYDFRNFMLRNLEIPIEPKSFGPPYKVVFSKFSSKTAGRVKGFGKQLNLLKKHFNQSYVQTESHRMSGYSLHEQARITSEAAIFVSVVGGGTVTATFAPRGSSIILFYESKGGIKKNVMVEEPARLDWDVLNHASHVRVHWLPVETLDEDKDLEFFLELVKHELHLISHQEL